MVIQIREEQNKAVDSPLFIVLYVNLFMLKFQIGTNTDIGITDLNDRNEVIPVMSSFVKLLDYGTTLTVHITPKPVLFPAK